LSAAEAGAPVSGKTAKGPAAPLATLVLLAVAAISSGGCLGGSGKTKAGVEAPKTLTLTMETPDGPDADAEYFIAQVKTRTNGRVRIIESSGPYSSVDADNELRLVRDLRRGKVKLAYIASRAWERDGVDSFRALQAPFLVTDYALLRRITTGPMARSMLDSLDRARLVGLGLVPNELRRPLGRRRLLSAADYRGARIRVITSPTSELVFRTLGATTVTNLDSRQAFGALEGHRLDGVESSAHSMEDNSYTRAAHYLPSNLAFFAKTQTIVIRRDIFDRLSAGDRSALREAAAVTVAHADPAAQERAEVQRMCTVGLRLVHATPADLQSLRHATAPAYAVLERDPLTKRTIAAIERLKQETQIPAAAPALPACARAATARGPGPTKTPFPQGTFETTLTRDDLRRAGLNPDDAHVERLTLTKRTWRDVWTAPSRADKPPAGGRLIVRGDLVKFVPTPDVLRWSYYRGRLTFKVVDVPDAGARFGYTAHAWRKVG